MSEKPEVETMQPTFKEELTDLINKHSLEGFVDMSDKEIAEYFENCFRALREAIESKRTRETISNV